MPLSRYTSKDDTGRNLTPELPNSIVSRPTTSTNSRCGRGNRAATSAAAISSRATPNCTFYLISKHLGGNPLPFNLRRAPQAGLILTSNSVTILTTLRTVERQKTWKSKRSVGSTARNKQSEPHLFGFVHYTICQDPRVWHWVEG